MSRLAWDIEDDILTYRKERLLRKNERLHKILNKKQPLPALPAVGIARVQKSHPTKGYAPIVTDLLKYQAMNGIVQELDKVYSQKDTLLRSIQHSELGIANPAQQKELDDIIRLEALLVSQMEELKEQDTDINSIQAIHTNMKMEAKEERITRGTPFAFPGMSDKKFAKLSNEDIAGLKEEQIDSDLEAWHQLKQGMEEHPELFGFEKEDRERNDERDRDELDALDEIENIRGRANENDRDVNDIEI
jgi:hypothetical protein